MIVKEVMAQTLQHVKQQIFIKLGNNQKKIRIRNAPDS